MAAEFKQKSKEVRLAAVPPVAKQLLPRLREIKHLFVINVVFPMLPMAASSLQLVHTQMVIHLPARLPMASLLQLVKHNRLECSLAPTASPLPMLSSLSLTPMAEVLVKVATAIGCKSNTS